ncbi:hypothetical protein CPC16_007721 [Podila verticillata]|nr:hypothetical protein CPC16_007721 [Podila verticillata]
MIIRCFRSSLSPIPPLRSSKRMASLAKKKLANATGEAKKEATLLSKTRKNGRKGAAATRSPEGTMMVCFGVTGNPTRIRLFKEAVTCNVSGWTILYVFQAIRKYD